MKKVKILIVLLSLTITLCACGNSKETETHSEIEETHITEETVASNEEKEQVNKIDVNELADTWWENKCFVSEKTGDKFYGFRYSEGGEPYFTYANVCIKISNGEREILNDDYFGDVIGYTFQTQMRQGNQMVYDEYYILYYVERDYVDVSNKNLTYSDTFNYDETLVLNTPSSNSETSSEELDLPDQEQIDYEENGALSVEEIQKCLPGDYKDSDGSELTITENEDKTYTINLDIFRLASFENCAGYFDNGSIYFTGKDPNDELIRGYVEIADSSDRVRVVFTDSKWTYIENYSSYEYDRVN